MALPSYAAALPHDTGASTEQEQLAGEVCWTDRMAPWLVESTVALIIISVFPDSPVILTSRMSAMHLANVGDAAQRER
jgi:hypothetical protein